MKNRIFFKLLAVFLVVITVTAVILDVMLGGAWQGSLRAEIERNLTQKTLLFAHRVETDRSHSLAEIAVQEGRAAGLAPPSSMPPARFSQIPMRIPRRWKTTLHGRSSWLRCRAKMGPMNAAALRWERHFSLSRLPFQAER
jgi:hypothetical protein